MNGNPPVLSATTILADPQYLYFPLLEVRANDVFCYLCEPFWDIGDGGVLPEEALEDMFGKPEHLLALDLETLRKATDQVEEVVEQYGVLNVLIPVHFDILADPVMSETYVEHCNTRVWSVLDYVYFEIVHPPANLSKERLIAVMDLIRPFAKGVMLRVGVGFEDFDNVPVEDILSAGIDFKHGHREEDEIIAELGRFTSQTAAWGLRSHVHGVDSIGLCVAAVNAGFDYVGSQAIAPTLDTWNPDDDRVKPSDLLKTLLASKHE